MSADLNTPPDSGANTDHTTASRGGQQQPHGGPRKAEHQARMADLRHIVDRQRRATAAVVAAAGEGQEHDGDHPPVPRSGPPPGAPMAPE